MPPCAQIRFSITNNSAEEVQYTVGENSFTLPPRYARTHSQCMSGKLSFPTGAEQETAERVPVSSGAKYLVMESGEIGVEDSPPTPDASAR